MRVGLLECKGTKSPAHSLKQLATASHQLRGLHIAARRPAGLAVSTVVSDNEIRFNALQLLPDGEDAPSEWPSPGDANDSTRGPEEPLADVDLESLRSPLPLGISDTLDVGAVALADLSLQASFALLADFSGNDRGFELWAPDTVRVKLSRDQRQHRERVVRSTGDGTDLVGITNVITLPGGQLEVFMGVRTDVDAALSSGDAEAVLRTQQGRATGASMPQTAGPGDDVHAIGSDGAALLLRPL